MNGSRIKHYLGGDFERLTTIVQLQEAWTTTKTSNYKDVKETLLGSNLVFLNSTFKISFLLISYLCCLNICLFELFLNILGLSFFKGLLSMLNFSTKKKQAINSPRQVNIYKKIKRGWNHISPHSFQKSTLKPFFLLKHEDYDFFTQKFIQVHSFSPISAFHFISFK